MCKDPSCVTCLWSRILLWQKTALLQVLDWTRQLGTRRRRQTASVHSTCLQIVRSIDCRQHCGVFCIVIMANVIAVLKSFAYVTFNDLRLQFDWFMHLSTKISCGLWSVTLIWHCWFGIGTLDDLEGPLRTLFQNVHLSEPTTKIRMKIDWLICEKPAVADAKGFLHLH